MTSFRRRTGLALLALLLLVIGARAVLPALIRAELESRLGDLIAGRVEIGDVDLELSRLAAALDDVRVLPESGEEAAIALGRIYARVRPLPLAGGRIHLAEIRVESPEVVLERRADGTFSLEALLPPAPDPEPAAETEEAAGAPALLLDRFVLEGGSFRFRDRAASEATPPLDVELSRVAIERLSLAPGAYDAPAELRLDAEVDGAPVTLAATARPGERGWALTATLDAKDVPIRRARTYLPRRGWRELEGRLEAALSWELDPEGRNVVRGEVALRDLAIRTARTDAPALAWRSLTVALEEVDVGREAARLGEVRLTGARLLVDPRADAPVPLLAEPAGAPPATVPSPGEASGPATDETPPADEEGEASIGDAPEPDGDVRAASPAALAADPPNETPAAAGARSASPHDPPPSGRAPEVSAEAAAPATDEHDETAAASGDAPSESSSDGTGGWGWSIATVVLDETTLVLAGEPVREIALGATLRDVSPDTDGWPLAAEARFGEGTLDVEGTVHTAAPQLRGAISWQALDLASLLSAATVATPVPVVAGTLQGTLRLAPGSGDREATVVSGDVRLEGFRTHATGPDDGDAGSSEAEEEAASDAEPDFWASLPAVELGIEAVAVDSAWAPVRIALDRIVLESPAIRLTRDQAGIVLPEAGSPEDDAPPAGKAPPRTGEEPRSDPAAGPPVSLGLLDVRSGRTVFVDRSIRPYYREELRDVSLRLEHLRWPRQEIGALEVKALIGKNGRIVLGGEPAEGGDLRLRFEGERIPLSPLNPYVQSLSGYAILDGELSTTSRVDLGDQRYRARNALTFHDLRLGGGRGESLFRSQFGISLSLGLALLRDVSGDIVLDVPVSGERGSTEVDVASVTGSALRRAIVNALASPLKLLGAVTLGGGKVEAVAPEPIPFLSGGDRLRKGAADRFQELASLLAGRPALALELRGAVDALDVRRVKEAAILEELRDGAEDEDSSGDAAGPRQKIRGYLEARAAGREATLGEAQASMLETLLAAHAVPERRLAEIAAARAARARERFVEKHGIDAERLRIVEPASEPAGPRGVVVELVVRD